MIPFTQDKSAGLQPSKLSFQMRHPVSVSGIKRFTSQIAEYDYVPPPVDHSAWLWLWGFFCLGTWSVECRGNHQPTVGIFICLVSVPRPQVIDVKSHTCILWRFIYSKPNSWVVFPLWLLCKCTTTILEFFETCTIELTQSISLQFCCAF